MKGPFIYKHRKEKKDIRILAITKKNEIRRLYSFPLIKGVFKWNSTTPYFTDTFPDINKRKKLVQELLFNEKSKFILNHSDNLPLLEEKNEKFKRFNNNFISEDKASNNHYPVYCFEVIKDKVYISKGHLSTMNHIKYENVNSSALLGKIPLGNGRDDSVVTWGMKQEIDMEIFEEIVATISHNTNKFTILDPIIERPIIGYDKEVMQEIKSNKLSLAQQNLRAFLEENQAKVIMPSEIYQLPLLFMSKSVSFEQVIKAFDISMKNIEKFIKDENFPESSMQLCRRLLTQINSARKEFVALHSSGNTGYSKVPNPEIETYLTNLAGIYLQDIFKENIELNNWSKVKATFEIHDNKIEAIKNNYKDIEELERTEIFQEKVMEVKVALISNITKLR